MTRSEFIMEKLALVYGSPESGNLLNPKSKMDQADFILNAPKYVKGKANEEPTGYPTAIGTGATVGGMLGAAFSGKFNSAGTAVGAGLGGALGALLSAVDRGEIAKAKALASQIQNG